MSEIDINFDEISRMIEFRRNNAYKKVNEELISLYWDFGKYISEKVNCNSWGNKVIEKMEEFLLASAKTDEEREFYIRMCIKNNYSKRELGRQISSGYYQRYMLSDGKANQSLFKVEGEDDYPNTKILDAYSLEFLDLPNQYSERDLKKAIISNMKNFILEIGRDFTYIGEEYKIQVGLEDFYIDLLFYNRDLSCLVAFELKIGKFKPEYISKMDFYLEALDRQEKSKVKILVLELFCVQAKIQKLLNMQ